MHSYVQIIDCDVWKSDSSLYICYYISTSLNSFIVIFTLKVIIFKWLMSGGGSMELPWLPFF